LVIEMPQPPTIHAIEPELKALRAADNRSHRLAAMLHIRVIDDLTGHAASPEFVEKIPIAFARRHNLLGLSNDRDRLTVAVSDLLDPTPLDVVSRYLGRSVRPVLASQEQIVAAINSAYQQRTGQAREMIDRIDRNELLAEVDRLTSSEDLLDSADRAPVIRLVNLLLFEAVQGRASDVHVQPYEDQVVCRYRIDGVLYDAYTLPKTVQGEMVSRIKVMAHMNIAEKRLPQDGRATVQVGDRSVDLRVATLPTTFGERAVIRLLDKGARLYNAAELGMDESMLGQFSRLIRSEHGIILSTGPTGSGKTTTLYAALREINSKERNILTLEDPVEYRLPGISQTQISEKKGMTFASGLRSVLRQDPDIIMVGEIRDHETAAMAIQSALTGHLVLSTLHTNDAASAVTRLLDLGIEPFLLASSLIGVLAQRLARRICPECAVAQPPPAVARLGSSAEKAQPGAAVPHVLRGAGCSNCRGTGFQGRLGMFELLIVDDAVRRDIGRRASAAEIRASAIAAGMRPLREDGLAKVSAGLTTPEEVIRITGANAE
jgi:general secretion pathway protein E